ncbi:uncharacterized protein LOC114928796 [Nylanderia fulva]|uniref:uncharacterized protein LOC114928796 n=1 Tax=Nylanderia fulva TaxID=613905 RepID=UPI0010FB6416|nr:uncharacterized protein LOC114928796 [Nylanderia fulva]
MEWIVIHFIEENLVEAVLVAWVHDDMCYWPPCTGKKLIHSVAVCEKPVFGVWPLFKIRKVGSGRTYNDLVKARAKTCTAEDTSDLTSDPERKRIRKKKKYLYDTDRGDESGLNNLLRHVHENQFDKTLLRHVRKGSGGIRESIFLARLLIHLSRWHTNRDRVVAYHAC